MPDAVRCVMFINMGVCWMGKVTLQYLHHFVHSYCGFNESFLQFYRCLVHYKYDRNVHIHIITMGAGVE